MGGMAGSVPVASTTARRAANVRSPTATVPGATSRPAPRRKVPPLPSKRSTATRSSQLSVASSRMRRGRRRPLPRRGPCRSRWHRSFRSCRNSWFARYRNPKGVTALPSRCAALGKEPPGRERGDDEGGPLRAGEASAVGPVDADEVFDEPGGAVQRTEQQRPKPVVGQAAASHGEDQGQDGEGGDQVV